MGTRCSVKLDESSQLADFRVIEPPHVLPSPVFPSRTQLAAMAVLAVGAKLKFDRQEF